MPQEKFITRRDAGIGNTRSGMTTTPSQRAASRISDAEIRQAMFDMAETDRDIRRATAQNAGSRAMRAQRQVGNQSGTSRLIGSAKEATGRLDTGKMQDIQPSRSAMANEYRAAAGDVRARDAANARIMRERLAARKSAASQSTKAVAGSALASGLAKGAGVAGVMIASQKAAGATPKQERALMQSAMNDPKSWYNTKGPGSVGRSYYNGQSPMSKMMGVGKKST